MYTVLPEGSDGSTASAPTCPEWLTWTMPPLPSLKKPALIEAGPTDVQLVFEGGLGGAVVKIRKLADAWSAATSPRPGWGTGFWKVSDQPLSVPTWPLA